MSKEDIVGDALESTKTELREVDREKHLVKAVEMLNQIEGSIREKEERFEDWYSLHFPELVDELQVEHLVKVLDSGVERSEIDSFEEMAEASNGADITEKEEEILQKMVSNLQSDVKTRDELEEYIEKLAKEEMPNLTKLLDTFIAARMIALAGGLEDLAKMPASTAQMLGAEKALFRFLRGNGSPPKHGILFEHEFVRPLQSNERGKMSRFLANKTVMAARLDFYGGEDKGEDFREEAREKFEELKG